MKLMCQAILESTIIRLTNKRFLKSCLSIGKKSVKDEEIYLLIQQVNRDSRGTKYKIKGNVANVFTKFINEGKTTIRLNVPALDIVIKADPLQLKSFINVLNLVISGKVNPPVLNLSNLDPKKIASLRTKVVIKSTANYPVLEGFPRTTEELYLVGLERKSFDRQILKLQSLTILNLSENQLTSLPQELGMLPSLQELHLANNQLGKSPISKWIWMSGSKLMKNLQLLNLNANQLTEVPYQLGKLYNLVSLFLNDNMISILPQGIGNLSLKYLGVARNNLTFLPGCLTKVKLVELDISDNPIQSEMSDSFFCNIQVPSLLDLAAQVVRRKRIYYDASVIPSILVTYLDKANTCMCGLHCFAGYYKKFALGKYNIAQNTKFSNIRGHQILYECYFCSTRCIKFYSNLT